MKLTKIPVFSALLALAGAALVPAAFAMPINANLSGKPVAIETHQTTIATFGVNDVIHGTTTSDPN